MKGRDGLVPFHHFHFIERKKKHTPELVYLIINQIFFYFYKFIYWNVRNESLRSWRLMLWWHMTQHFSVECHIKQILWLTVSITTNSKSPIYFNYSWICLLNFQIIRYCRFLNITFNKSRKKKSLFFMSPIIKIKIHHRNFKWIITKKNQREVTWQKSW